MIDEPYEEHDTSLDAPTYFGDHWFPLVWYERQIPTKDGWETVETSIDPIKATGIPEVRVLKITAVIEGN